MIQVQPTVELSIERMTMADIDEVSRIERRSFSNPWPMSAYRRELRRQGQNSYFVLRVSPQPVMEGGDARSSRSRFIESIIPVRRSDPNFEADHLAGYVGMWHLYDETHITTIAVDPPYRGRGIGEVLLVTSFAEAAALGSAWISLEVRVSNTAARALYLKYGMTIHGRREGYYTDNREDALVMWSRSLRDAVYWRQIDALRDQLQAKLPEIDLPALVRRHHGGSSDDGDPARS